MPPSTKAEETRVADINGGSRFVPAARASIRRRCVKSGSAREAGVALGSAYYYFASKEALVMAFYEQASQEMAVQIETGLEEAKGLESRLRAILHVKFQYFAPNRLFLGALARHAADPANRLSPFSDETAHIRELDLRHFAVALEGSRIAMPKDLAPYLPKLMWLYQMGLILFWISDASPNQIRTRRLLEKSLSLVVTAFSSWQAFRY